MSLSGHDTPRSAEKRHAPELEDLAFNQRPKTNNFRDVKLYRYESTDLYQWWAKDGTCPFEDPFGEPFVITAREEPSQEGAGEPVAATINWLRSLQDNGHCGEGTSERIQRERRNEHLDIAIKALTSPPNPQARIAALEGALEPFAEAARKAQISGYPPFQFVGAPEYAAALAALNQGADHGE